LGSVSALLSTSASALPPIYRSRREFITLNTASYEIIVQKDGHLTVNRPSGASIFRDVTPAIWIEGEKGPRMLKVDGRQSIRENVQDRLGEGQGITLMTKDCQWTIRAYPTKPFLTVQVAYTNSTKKPVRIKMLSPWSTGAKGGLTLGPGTAEAAILENGRVFSANDDFPRLSKGESLSQWNSAMYNPRNRQSLISGFLSNVHGYTLIRVEAAALKDEPELRRYAAECIYETAIELAPGTTLESEPLYLAVAEQDRHEGLERFAHAYAVASGIDRNRKFLPHGWDSWSTHLRTDINEAHLLKELDVIERELKRYGWNHFAIDDGWQIARGNWEPNPKRFPNGMKAFVEQIHARGMTAGIWTAPFTVSPDAPIAREHPEWLREPNAVGKMLLHDGDKILDVTAPGAYEHVREVYRRIREEWGFDALMEADYVYHLLLAESYHDTSLTRVEVFRRGMQAIREGFGRDGFIMSFTPGPVTASYANGLRTGTDCAPIWRKQPDKWPLGAVETLTCAARRYYFSPYVWAPDQDCAFFAHDESRKRWDVSDKPALTRQQSIAWLTAAALTAGVVKIGDAFSILDKQELEILRRLLPAPEAPARPIDIFESENPRIWSLPTKSKAGDWNIVALFNWDETASQSIPLNLDEAGMQAHAYYAVYDFWAEKYFGVAQGKLNVSVPAGGVRLLTFREFEQRPMFLSIDNHILQGAHDFTALAWDNAKRVISGSFNAIENTDYVLRVLVPKEFTIQSSHVSCGETATTVENEVLALRFHCSQSGPVRWTTSFT
jgi:hypothetical protein